MGLTIVCVGGGSYHLPPMLRDALAVPGVFEDGEIRLVDLAPERAELVGRFIEQSPEFADAGCRIRWDLALEPALEGADAVTVTLMCGSMRSQSEGVAAAAKRGQMASDNISLPGSFLGLKTAPLLLDLAARMERICPRAVLADFANAAGLLGGMVSKHTKIRCLGICGGAVNHQWDLTRIVEGRDEWNPDFDVEAAGINHLSFIQRGSYRGEDIFAVLDRRLGDGAEFTPPPLQPWTSDNMRYHIPRGLRRLVQIYRELGVMLYSSEGDGLNRFFPDDITAEQQRQSDRMPKHPSAADAARAERTRRERADASFRAMVEDGIDWAEHWKQDARAGRRRGNVLTHIFTGLSGVQSARVAASTCNRGAITNLPEGAAVEHTQVIEADTIRPAGKYRVQPTVYGMVAALAAHQTLVGDAVATDDPKLLAQAILAYPDGTYSQAQRELGKELLAINHDEIPAPMRRAVEYL